MADDLSIKDCIRALLTNDNQVTAKAITALIQIIDNVLYRFDDGNNGILLLSSSVMMDFILPALGAMELLFCVGFQEEEDKLVLRDMAAHLDLLASCKNELLEHYYVRPPHNLRDTPNNATETSLRPKLEKQFLQMEFFEIPELQRKAKELIPLDKLNRLASEKFSNLHVQDPSVKLQDCLLMELMSWFKEDFFSWFDSGFCESCQQKMKFVSTQDCNRQEREALGVRTELHGCTKCSSVERFPRYFYPGTLLRTRKGRCMEWVSCFMLMCRSLHFDTRYILDETDHVWNEIYFSTQDRWVHLDPCENKLDCPLMYEKGWNKKLVYVYAFSKDQMADCVWKYSTNHKAVRDRRTKYRESYLAATIQSLNDEKQKDFTMERRNNVHKRTIKEIVEFFKPPKAEGDYGGRCSGSLAWRLSRGETSSSSVVESRFTFTPTTAEVEAREMVVKYSIIRDSYLSSGDIDAKWDQCIFSSKNIFRKHEKDWKNIYLCRTEGSDEGEISWRFDWSELNLKLKSVFVEFSHKTFENGSVQWQLRSKDVCIPGTSAGRLELTRGDFKCDEVEELHLCCSLSGGRGDVNWQHAQLFRQNEKDGHSFPFVVHLKFD